MDERSTQDQDFFSSSRMSLGDHLEELRRCLLYSLYGLLVGLLVCLLLADKIIGFIVQPLLLSLHLAGVEPRLYVSSPPEAFLTYIKVALIGGIFLASPWIFYQLWTFVSAGLYPHEKRYVHTFVPFSALLFILGGIFFTLVVAPISFHYFITFSSKWQSPDLTQLNPITEKIAQGIAAASGTKLEPASEGAAVDDPCKAVESSVQVQPSTPRKGTFVEPLFTLQKYVNLVLILSLAFGLAFQTPLAVFLLGRLSLISIETFQRTRKYAFFGIVILSALMTPPDVISQIALSLPMYGLYEFGILMLRLWPKRKTGESR